MTKGDVNHYYRQIDEIVDRYLGRNHFISYYEANDFISELEEIIDNDVLRMIDNGNYLSAFDVINYVFRLIGDVDMDDSAGGTGRLSNYIYRLWLELLVKVNPEEKRTMFQWFSSNLDGSIIDYLEEYIEKIIMDEFQEEEYGQLKRGFIETMISKAECKETEWSRNYAIGKWAIRYLEIMKEKKEYNHVLRILDECILLDKDYRGLVAEYSEKKKMSYILQGNNDAYIEQLWKLVLNYDAGNLEVYRELKKQYIADEWLVKREEVFERLSDYANVEKLYKEEKLYDRLLEYVLKSLGLYALQEYGSVLKEEYPKEILGKYREEVDKMALRTSERKQYAYLVSILRRNMWKVETELLSRLLRNGR